VSANIKPPKKSAAESEARAIIARYPDYQPWTAHDLRTMEALTGLKIHSIEVRPGQYRNQRCLWASVEDADPTSPAPRFWSWPKAIKRNYSDDRAHTESRLDRADALNALRYAVEPDIEAYRANVPTSARRCAACGRLERLQVDHRDRPFLAIAESFLLVNEISLCDEPRGLGKVICDPQQLAAWILFHRERATYQMLCPSHNAQKGARFEHGERG
jgi:hypothetical protein